MTSSWRSPAVQRMIEKRLAGDDAAAQGADLLFDEGAGYSCLVGQASGLLHPRPNPKKTVGMSSITARSSNSPATGMRASPSIRSRWEPNAGTMMVKDIMNGIKRRYAWIDLLKPETKAAVGVLAVLDPSQLGKISRTIPILWEKLRGTLETARPPFCRRNRRDGPGAAVQGSPRWTSCSAPICLTVSGQGGSPARGVPMTCCGRPRRTSPGPGRKGPRHRRNPGLGAAHLGPADGGRQARGTPPGAEGLAAG
ncbi:MAG: hypothetical protein MZV70_34760 [Desulfobacterales bacterium]|nr:hypothetical protein [Desulfobacterales bacterium]